MGITKKEKVVGDAADVGKQEENIAIEAKKEEDKKLDDLLDDLIA